MVPKKILISGGWGYANLGDDAIMSSTIGLVKSKYPTAEIVVMTYDPDDAKRIIKDKSVRFIPSVHRTMIGDMAFQKFEICSPESVEKGKVKKDTNFLKLRRKILRRYFAFKERKAYKKYLSMKAKLKTLPQFAEFKTSDVFILSGGGYFNGTWRDNLFAHVLEFDIAHSLGIRSLFIGHSIGPFPDHITFDVAQSAFQNAHHLSVRDQDSYNDLINYGYSPSLIPDVALADLTRDDKRSHLILVTGGRGLSDTDADILANAILLSQKKIHFPVKIIVSRLWNSDINSAHKIMNRLEKIIDQIEVVIPKNFIEAQLELSKGKVVVSQNLHGLIMGWRAGAECVSLSFSRKFVSFMEQTSQLDRLITDRNFNVETINLAIENAFASAEKETDLRSKIADKVIQGFSEKLETVLNS